LQESESHLPWSFDQTASPPFGQAPADALICPRPINQVIWRSASVACIDTAQAIPELNVVREQTAWRELQ
jgi:hypothetical protein